MTLTPLAPMALEHSKALEQLRVLEQGHRILAIETAHHVGLSIEPRKRAEEFLATGATTGRWWLFLAV